MTIRKEQMDALRNAGLDRFRRERLLALRNEGFEVEEDKRAGEVIVRDACGGEARVKSRGATTSITSAEGRTVITEQHETGRIVGMSDGTGQSLRMEREPDGTIKSMDCGQGSIYRFSVTPDDKLLELRYPDGTKTKTDFHDSGRPKTVTDRNGNQVHYEYEELGLISGIVDARGNRTKIEYEDWDSPSAIEYANGNRHEFEYDPNGQLQLMRANGKAHGRYQFNDETGEYDVDFEDGTTAHFVLQGEKITEATNETGTVRFQYDDQGRLLEEDANGQVVRYIRNELGVIIAIETPKGDQIQFERDRDQRLKGIINWNARHYGISYGKSGPPTAIVYPNGVTLATQRNRKGQCASWELAYPPHVVREDDGLQRFEYDTCDRVVSMNRGIERRTFQYDKAGRLLGVDSTNEAFTEQFELDANGNRIRDAAGGSEYDEANQLLKRGSQSFTYDDLGSVTSVEGGASPKKYTWNGRGQLVAAQTSRGPAKYAYDAIGRRIRKELGNEVTEYVWAGVQLLSETTTRDGEVLRQRDYLVCPERPGAPLAMREDNDKFYYFHIGRLQEVQSVTDDQGHVVWKADYLAFGKAVVSVSEIDQPWRYAGHYHEPETGLDYVVARYYASDLGRYLSRDPLLAQGGSQNFYIYCDGDPLNRIDPTGEIGAFWSAVVIGAAVGLVVGAAIGAGIEMYRQRNQEEYNWGKIGKAALIGGAVGVIGGAVGAAVGAGAAAVGAGVVAAGAVAGGIGAGVEYCAEVALTDAEFSLGGLATSVGIGVAIGAVTAGVGGVLAARAARKAAREAAEELAEKAAKEAAEKAAKEAAEKAAKEAADEAAEKAAKEAAEKATKEAQEKAAKEAAEKAAKVEAQRHVDELATQGHAPQRHGPDITKQQLTDRAVHKKDPMTGSTTDGVHGGNHGCGKHATKFNSNEAMANADNHLRNHPDFAAEKAAKEAAGENRFAVEVPLEDVYGPGYRDQVSGVTRGGSNNYPTGNPPGSAPPSDTNFAGGTVKAVYQKQPDGSWGTYTMYPNPPTP